MKHQRQQAERFRLLWHQLGHQSGQKQGFGSEISTLGIRPLGIGPPIGKRGVDGVQYSFEPAGKLLTPGNAEGNTGLANFVFRANETLNSNLSLAIFVSCYPDLMFDPAAGSDTALLFT